MQKIVQYRHNESICRQRAVFDFENNWRWLAEAEMWSDKAQDEVSAHFAECTESVATTSIPARPLNSVIAVKPHV